MLAALDPFAVILHFEDRVDDFAPSDMVKRRLKEVPLPEWCHVGKDDDEAHMDRSTIIERKEV
jgi:hypothetical protein